MQEEHYMRQINNHCECTIKIIDVAGGFLSQWANIERSYDESI